MELYARSELTPSMFSSFFSISMSFAAGMESSTITNCVHAMSKSFLSLSKPCMEVRYPGSALFML